MSLVDYLEELLAIESPTFKEDQINDFIQSELNSLNPDFLHRCDNGIVCEFGHKPDLPSLAFVGHTDVVPAYFKPYIEDEKLYGAGASDMKGGVACFLYLVKDHLPALLKKYNITLVIYTKEEGTALEVNGLYGLMQKLDENFKRIDCAIVGEPTDNAIQLGCLGSLHAKVEVLGKEAHSARPWNGENALYKALPLVQHFASYEPQVDVIQGLEFKEVLSITECTLPQGRTTIPGSVSFNVNFRFSPNRSDEDAFAYVNAFCEQAAVDNMTVTLIDSAPSGAILSNTVSESIIRQLDANIEAKQAWTDVAQLSKASITAFNFGPGSQTQAHRDDEYIDLGLLEAYYKKLQLIL